jgi:hypothetical protein
MKESVALFPSTKFDFNRFLFKYKKKLLFLRILCSDEQVGEENHVSIPGAIQRRGLEPQWASARSLKKKS